MGCTTSSGSSTSRDSVARSGEGPSASQARVMCCTTRTAASSRPRGWPTSAGQIDWKRAFCSAYARRAPASTMNQLRYSQSRKSGMAPSEP